MNDSFYKKNTTVIINFTSDYKTNFEEILAGKTFIQVLSSFIQELQTYDAKLYTWIVHEEEVEDIIAEIVQLFKLLTVLKIEEIEHRLLEDPSRLLQFVEGMYSYWRKLQRCTMIHTDARNGLQASNFIESDTRYNQLILSFYRTIQEKLQGRKNQVYRQLQAGSNASIVLRDYKWQIPAGYENLKNISFINAVMLRTPLLLHTLSNKRMGTFIECETSPLHEFSGDKNTWMCYPCKVGSLLAYVYFHQEFIFTVLGLANLFEMASEEECRNRKPDLIVLYGNEDGKEDTVFHHDAKENIWIGKISHFPDMDYFGYMKKITLTLHNLAMIDKGWLPLHGAMVILTLANQEEKGIILIGDSGAGKSETIEALQKLNHPEILAMKIIFDDMGTLHLEESNFVAQGTEVGAFIRLDDLDKASAYRDMDRSIFYNPESSNARVVIPVIGYEEIIKNHAVDMILYANNYEEKKGIAQFETKEEALAVFKRGRRLALGTTQEKGLSDTYFANPFGVMQKQEICDELINQMFTYLFEKDIFVGELYSWLGLKEETEEHLKDAAENICEVLFQREAL